MGCLSPLNQRLIWSSKTLKVVASMPTNSKLLMINLEREVIKPLTKDLRHLVAQIII